MGEAFDDRLVLDEGCDQDEEGEMPSESCTPVCCQGRSCAYCSCADLLMAERASSEEPRRFLSGIPSLRGKLEQSQAAPDREPATRLSWVSS